jgi:DivIVA domain-containing protein
MMWVFAILIVLAMGSIAVVAAGRGTPLQEEYDDRPDVLVPVEDEPIGAGDLKAVRFSLAVRGYRMSEVDALLTRLAKQLEDAAGEPVPLALPAPERHEAPPATPPAGQAAPRSDRRPAEGEDPA